VQPHGPYYISGFSSGGTAAFEMATQLRARGELVGLLLLLESVSPTLPEWTLIERARYHAARLRAEGRSYLVSAPLKGLSTRMGRTRLGLLSRAARLFPYRFRNEAVEAAWGSMERRYRPKPYAGTVHLLRSRVRDTLVFDPHNGWNPVVLGELVVVEVDGSHADFATGPRAAQTAARITEALMTARAPDSKVRAVTSSDRVSVAVPETPSEPFPLTATHGASNREW